MELTLRQIVTEAEIDAIVREAVEAILDKSISFAVIAEGVTAAPQGFECPECGQTGFASAAAMAGHRYWKHSVATDSKKTPAQLKRESSVRTSAMHNPAKKARS
jgi:hypothetical protein